MHVHPFLLLFAASVTAQGAADPRPTRVAHGRVFDVLGDPVPAAQVTAVVDGRVVAGTTSDGDGLFHLTRVPVTGVELRVIADGKAELRRDWPPSGGSQGCALTLEDGCRLRGRVCTADARSVPGATVILLTTNLRAEVTTDASGHWLMPGVPLRGATLRAFASGRSVEHALARPADADCDLTLPPASAGSRTVHVHGLPPEILARASLEVVSHDLALQPRRGMLPLREDGTADFVPWTTSMIRLLAPGFVAAPEGMLVGPDGNQPLVFVATPEPPGPRGTIALCGSTRTIDGRGLAGVRLIAVDRFERPLATTDAGADGGFVLPLPLAVGARVRLGIELRTGQFSADDARNTRTHSWLDLDVDPDRRLDLTIVPTADLRGRAITASGVILAFAEVSVLDPDTDHEVASLVADGNGVFEFIGLPDGPYRVVAATKTGEVVVADAHPSTHRHVEIGNWRQQPTGTIEGRVVDAAGRPLPAADLQLWCAEPDTAMEGQIRSRRVITDRHGRFRCRGAVTGGWHASLAMASDDDVTTFRVVADRTTTVDTLVGR